MSITKGTNSGGIRRYPYDDRLAIYPIYRPDIYDHYRLQKMSIWHAEEIEREMGRDAACYKTELNDDEKNLVDFILAFFSQGDGLINVNTAQRFIEEINIPEISVCLRFQMMMEDIHNETYSMLIDRIITDPDKKEMIMDSVRRLPIIGEMADWMRRCLVSDEPLAKRLFSVMCFEGIFFQGCFISIDWFGRTNRMPALTTSNRAISSDENSHTVSGSMLFLMCESRPEREWLLAEAAAATDIGSRFMRLALRRDLPGLKYEDIVKFLKYQADYVLSLVNEDPLYGEGAPELRYMESRGRETKANFFERGVMEYRASHDVDVDEW